MRMKSPIRAFVAVLVIHDNALYSWYKKTGPHSESGLVYQFKRNGPHHNPRYRCSIETVIECGVTPIILAQLNSFKTFDVDANLASTIVIGWFLVHR